MIRTLNELWLPLVRALGMTPLFKHDQSLADEDVDAEDYIRHHWIVGSPETVADKLVELDQLTGGFGTLLSSASDCREHPEPVPTGAIYDRIERRRAATLQRAQRRVGGRPLHL